MVFQWCPTPLHETSYVQHEIGLKIEPKIMSAMSTLASNSNSPVRVSLVRKYGNLRTTPNCPCTRCKLIRRKKLEEKWWIFGKKFPGVKVIYAVIRGYSKFYDGDSEEGWKCVAVGIGGICEIAFFYYFGVYSLIGPFGYVICASLPGNLIGGGLETAVKFNYWEPSEDEKNFPWEEEVYDNVLRDIAFVGCAYSAATAAHAYATGDEEKAKQRGKNAAVNLAVSSLAYGVAKGLSKVAESPCECPPSSDPTSAASSSGTSTSLTHGTSSALPDATKQITDKVPVSKIINAAQKVKDVIMENVDPRLAGVASDTVAVATISKATFLGKCANRVAPVAPNVTQAVAQPLLNAAVDFTFHQRAPVLRETAAALLYRNCPSAQATIGSTEPKYKYITRCILHSQFGLVTKDNGDPLDEKDIKQLAHNFLETGDPHVIQAVFLWLPFAAPASASFCEEDQVEIIEGAKRRLLTRYLVQKMHPGTKNVQFPEVLKNDKDFQQFECPKSQLKYQPARDNNGQIKTRGPSGLCLDGGGICGLNSLEILDLIESQLAKKAQCQDQSSLQLDRIFDYYVGTSVGAIICAALLHGKSIVEIKKLMFKLKDQIFSGSKPHDGNKLEAIFKEYFGENLTLAQLGQELGVKLVIPVSRTDVSPFELEFYTNIDGDSRRDEKVWKVLLRATAAPSFFPCPKEPAGHPQHLDGGLMANNATKAFIAYLRNQRMSPGFILSIGTGKFNRQPTARFPSILGQVLVDGRNIKRIITDFALQMTEADGHVVEDHASLCHHSGCSYYRLTPTLSENIELNETDDLKLLKMLFQTKAYVYENRGKVQKIVTDLVEFRGLRKTTADAAVQTCSSSSISVDHEDDQESDEEADEEEEIASQPTTSLRRRRVAA